MSTVIASVTGRIMETYGLIFTREKAEAARAEIAKYLNAASAKGETDEERLAVGCMKYLRERDQLEPSRRRRPSSARIAAY